MARKRKSTKEKSELVFGIKDDQIEIFCQDVDEHLEQMEAGILQLERAKDDDTLNAVFRAAHTLKAIAATIGHTQMADLTHTLETILDRMREGEIACTQKVTDELLTAADVLKALRNQVVTRQPGDVDVDAILVRLRETLEGKQEADQGVSSAPAQALLSEEQAARARELAGEGYAVLKVEIAAAGASVGSARLLQAAMALEQVAEIVAEAPSRADLLDEGSDRDHMELVVATREGEKEIRQALADVPELSEVLVQPYSTDEPGGASPGPPRSPAGEKTVRIGVERLDALMNLVGELVTDRTRLEQVESSLHGRYGQDEDVGTLNEAVTHLGRVVDQLQEEVMQARMLPMSYLFARFPRLVRDLSRAAAKQVDLVIEGGDTELDRSVIELIGDPVIHLLRNAVDHGIEEPAKREAAGKPAAGTIWLTAGHEEGHVVITVKDDGQGINPARIREAAVARGLLSQEQVVELDDDAATSLIFSPNLSTAGQVTGVSGRGVGLDVVRANVRQMGGAVVVDSEAGAGVTFRLTLPLTLAIVQAMLVALRGDVYAIPLTSVVETLYLSDVEVGGVKGRPVVRWRDSVLPLLHLRRFFTHPRLDGEPPAGDEGAIVAVAWGKQQVGLIVDRLIGKREIVIKALNPILGSITGLSGCAILGDGSIALIIDIPGLVGATMHFQRQL